MAVATAAVLGAAVRRAEAEMDDAALVAAVVAGERGAFETLYHRHKTALFRTAVAVTRDQAAAEELLQEAFLRAFRHMGQVQLAAGASLRPWLHRVLINLAYDWSARERHRGGPLDAVAERLLAAPGASSPEGQAEARELRRRVRRAIDDLPVKHRIVVILFYVHDMDLQSIAEVIGVPPGTVKSRLFYARARLREALADEAPLAGSWEVGYVRAG